MQGLLSNQSKQLHPGDSLMSCGLLQCLGNRHDVDRVSSLRLMCVCICILYCAIPHAVLARCACIYSYSSQRSHAVLSKPYYIIQIREYAHIVP